jgi:uncharacterized iron-regulated membrane protein
LHRWAGLVTGAIIVVASITGAILVYEPELDRAINPHLWRVPDRVGARLPVSALIDIVSDRDPLRRVNSLALEDDPRVAVVAYPGRDLQVFLDPLNGEILGARIPSKTLFGRVYGLHSNLLMGKMGNTVVALSTVVLLIVIVLGVWLWWPQTRAKLKPSLRLHFGRGWKRANYDLHHVLGFYAAVVLIFLAATGVMIAYPGLTVSLGRLLLPDASVVAAQTTSAATITPAAPVSRQTAGSSTTGARSVVDLAVAHAEREFPGAFRTNIRFPPPRGGPLTVVKVMSAPSEPRKAHRLTFDADTGELLRVARHSDATAAEKANRSIGEIHLGTVYGWPTKAIAFVVSLIAGTLPVTGAIVWFPRWRRKRRRKRMRARSAIGA